MDKIKVTAQQRANAIEALTVMWPSVPPENVVGNLCAFRYGLDRFGNAVHFKSKVDCKALACFGGWVVCWPAFMAQGAYADDVGYPHLRGDKINDGAYGVARHLFGLAELFHPRSSMWKVIEEFGPNTVWGFEQDTSVSDHEVVKRRLKWLIKNSEVIA